MPEGMVGIRLVSGQPEAEQGDYGRACIGEVVERIGRDGNRAGENPRRKLSRKQKKNEENAENPAEHAVFPAQLLGVELLGIFDKQF